MRKIIFFLAALLALCVVPALGQTDGRSLYVSKCRTCHGRDGSGQTTVGQSLGVNDIRLAIKNMTDDQLGLLILEGRGKMPANKKFDDQKVASLTLFLRDLAAGNPNTGRATVEAQAQTMDDVAGVYQKKCSTCHGRDGTGRTTAGKSLGVPDLIAPAMQEKGGAEWVQVINKGKGKMPSYAKTFTSAQMDQLVSYILSLPEGASATPNASAAAAKVPPSSAAPASAASHAGSVTTPAGSSGTAATTHKPAPSAAGGAAAAPSTPSSTTAATASTGSASAVVPHALKAPPSKPPLSGRQIYGAKCSTCHARDGSGTGTVGLNLHVPSLISPEVQAKSDEDLAGVIANGMGNMPAYKKKYSPEQIQRLVAYLRELGNKR